MKNFANYSIIGLSIIEAKKLKKVCDTYISCDGFCEACMDEAKK